MAHHYEITISEKHCSATDLKGWLCGVVVRGATEEKLMEALCTGPYGRCVSHCGNDVGASVESHVMALAAEASRRDGGRVVTLAEF